ncbi:hypothetical protein NDU88_005733 [Pleurodeles waltl]|uniref:LINE-1 type transposase domain-containing protein 1 n=1 Tax=Pleurodeles waltl TaxID=8319 RepID=A0AAV7TC59_PLEWA|nr:hypothetical protein NDU88_005733 [Pleurodeles waltl]
MCRLELRVKDTEGRARRSNLRVVGFPEGAEGSNPEAFLEDWIKRALPNASLSTVFVVEHAHRALAPPPPPGAPTPAIITKVLNHRDRHTILQEVRKYGDPSYESHIICFSPDYTREVQLQRKSFMGVKRKLKELGYTYMLLFPAKLKVLHAGSSHSFQTPEAVWDWLELGSSDGTPRPQSGGVREQPAKMGNIQCALRRTTRRRRATRSAKVMVRSDGPLSLDKRRQEREEARLLVRSVGPVPPERMVDWHRIQTAQRPKSCWEWTSELDGWCCDCYWT